MNRFTMLASSGLLMMGGAAYAQDTDGYANDPAAPPSEMTEPMESMPDTSMPEDTMPDETMPDDASDPMPADPAEMDSMDTMPAPDTAMPAQGDPMAGDMAFTDTEIQSFATAAMQIQNLQGDPATTQEQAATIVAGSGIDAATFNAIGQAMQTDPAVAERVQVAAAAMAPTQPAS